ncbi:MAG: hypothetical protein R3D33_06095 [Hyphomicrobiaceae bacterium]
MTFQLFSWWGDLFGHRAPSRRQPARPASLTARLTEVETMHRAVVTPVFAPLVSAAETTPETAGPDAVAVQIATLIGMVSGTASAEPVAAADAVAAIDTSDTASTVPAFPSEILVASPAELAEAEPETASPFDAEGIIADLRTAATTLREFVTPGLPEDDRKAVSALIDAAAETLANHRAAAPSRRFARKPQLPLSSRLHAVQAAYRPVASPDAKRRASAPRRVAWLAARPATVRMNEPAIEIQLPPEERARAQALPMQIPVPTLPPLPIGEPFVEAAAAGLAA